MNMVDCVLELVVYSNIKRRAVFNRMKPKSAVGITSRFMCNGERHLLFLDIDGGSSSSKSVFNYLYANKLCNYISVVKTMKGYHVICFNKFKFNDCIKHWRRLSTFIDPKWINLQIKLKRANYRSGAILRVSGKYGVKDIVPLLFIVFDDSDKCVNKLFYQYLLLVGK